MDEASGNALDSVGSNDLTDNNTVGSATGKIGNARDFEDGNSESFSHADNADFSTGDIDFTVAAWVNLESKGADRPIVGKWEFGTNKEYHLFYDIGNDRFAFVSGTNDFVLGNNFGSPSTGTWYHVVGWYDAANDQLGVSINAGTANTGSITSPISDQTASFFIGHDEGGNAGYMDGLIDEVGFWKRVLTSQERTDLYNGGAGLTYPFSSQDAPELYGRPAGLKGQRQMAQLLAW